MASRRMGWSGTRAVSLVLLERRVCYVDEHEHLNTASKQSRIAPYLKKGWVLVVLRRITSTGTFVIPNAWEGAGRG